MNGRARFAWGLVLVVAILHFDFWAWEDDTLVFGFVPMALAFHAGISLAAALSWFLVVRFAWPEGIEEWANGAGNAPTGAPEGGASDADPH